eukprot:GDKH01018721.1.p1 GENE.GDKH01018721.1~~GDKH01018721.1.p1  ORF type:complete len:262 (+),score=30.24 GDKH01018721.1:105-890(+)
MEPSRCLLPGDAMGVSSDAAKSLAWSFEKSGQKHTCLAGYSLPSPLYPHAPEVVNWRRKYIPAVNDIVIGIVQARFAEHVSVDIGAVFQAVLPLQSFHNATKRNRPDLKRGAVVCCGVVRVQPGAETELTCLCSMDTLSWVNHRNYFGELSGGTVFEVCLAHAAVLMADHCTVLDEIGSRLPFEIAVGRNGRVWVNAPDQDGGLTSSLAIADVVTKSLRLSPVMTAALVRRVFGDAIAAAPPAGPAKAKGKGERLEDEMEE